MKANQVIVEFIGIGTTEGNNRIQYDAPDGYVIEDVLPAFASNGAGVVIVTAPGEVFVG